MNYKKLLLTPLIIFLSLLVLLILLLSTTFAIAAAPPQPSNLSYQVYSKTSAELFWDRPATVGLRYEIERNGNVLSTTDGVSFYDD